MAQYYVNKKTQDRGEHVFHKFDLLSEHHAS